MDQEVRGRAPRDLAQGLRAPEVADRWYQQLTIMKKSAEAQLAAKAADDKQQRITLLSVAEDASSPEQARDMRRRADEARASFLKWRSGVLRFRSGVEERLAEAQWRRRLSPVTVVAATLLDERDQLLRQVELLRGAIETHRSSMADLDDDDIDEADEILWGVMEALGPNAQSCTCPPATPGGHS